MDPIKYPLHSFWSSRYSKKGITWSLLVVLSMFVFFLQYFMPIPLALIGISIIFFFFLAMNYYRKVWSEMPMNLFLKKLFWHSLAFRLLFIVIMYLITYLYAPHNLPFEVNATDSWVYHMNGVKLAGNIFNGKFISILSPMWESSDWGFNIFIGIIYTFTGPNVFIIQIINCILGSLSIVFLAKLTRLVFTDIHAKLTGLLGMLFPSFLWFNAMVMKETLMIFMIIVIFYNTLLLQRSLKHFFLNIGLIVSLNMLLFYFRPFLAIFVSICIFISFLTIILKKRKNMVALIAILLILSVSSVYLMKYFNFNEMINQIMLQTDNRLQSEMEQSAKQVQLSYDKAFVLPFMFAGAIITPFPSFLYFEARQIGIIAHFQNEMVRNILYFFFFIGLYLCVKYAFKETALITAFALGYIFILALAGNAFQDRFRLPALPFVIIIISVGLIGTQKKWVKYWDIYLAIIFFAEFAWNGFKLYIRGLLF